MANTRKTAPIHLSNKTAMALRKTAKRVRSAWLIAMGIFAMLATVTAVYLGFVWLPAVPLTLLAAGVIVMLMLLISRSQYLMLISQAICTEAASRGMQERESEKQRRRQAIEQLAEIRADVRAAQQKGLRDAGEGSDAALLFDLLTGWEHGEEENRRKSGSEEDDELYAADYREDGESYADEDLRPAKPAKKAPAAPVASVTNERPAVAAAAAQRDHAEQQEEDTQAPRRRRRSAPSQTASLKLIRGEQAQ